MAGSGLFKVQGVNAGLSIANPFGTQIFSRLLVTNQDTVNTAEIVINGESDNLAPGEQVEYYGDSVTFVVNSATAGAGDDLVIRAFS